MSTIRSFAAAMVLVLTLGCGAQIETTGPHDVASAKLVGGALGAVEGTLLSCQILPYASTTMSIGPEGGKIKVGPHELVIPKGALAATTTITAELPGDAVSSIRFSPEGLQFATPATLTLKYSGCKGAGMLLPKRVAYTTDQLDILEILPSIDQDKDKKVTTSLDHFSRYAVAY